MYAPNYWLWWNRVSNALKAFLLILALVLAGYLLWDPASESYIEVTPTSSSSPTASDIPSQTPSVTPTPSRTPSPTPSETPTPTPTEVNLDPDFDGFIGSADHCPETWGPAISADTNKPGCPVIGGGGNGSSGGEGDGNGGNGGDPPACPPWGCGGNG